MDTKANSDDSRTAATVLPLSTVLRNAAELLETAGWIQNDYKCSKGYCAAGAIAQVATGDAFALELGSTNRHDHAFAAEEFLTGLLGIGIESWNDARVRTQAEVVAKLREAAALAESEGR